MSFYSNKFYNTTSPEDLHDNGVRELISLLKQSIDDEQLKDMRSYLSQLKLAINPNFPMFTRETATFGAYVYAVNENKKKAAKSILAAALKKNYTYFVFPIETLISNLTHTEMKFVIDDILSVSTQWHLEGLDAIEKMLKEFPNETAQLIENGRLNKFEKIDNKVEIINLIINLGNEKAILGALNAFLNEEYMSQYGIHPLKLQKIFDTLDTKPKNIQKNIRNKFFYKSMLRSINHIQIENDFKNGILDEEIINTYVSSLLEKNLKALLIQTLNQLKDDKLRTLMIFSNSEFSNFILQNHIHLIPEKLKNIFLF